MKHKALIVTIIAVLLIIIADGGYFSSQYIKDKNKFNNYIGEIASLIDGKEYDKAEEIIEKAKALDADNPELKGYEEKLNSVINNTNKKFKTNIKK